MSIITDGHCGILKSSYAVKDFSNHHYRSLILWLIWGILQATLTKAVAVFFYQELQQNI